MRMHLPGRRLARRVLPPGATALRRFLENEARSPLHFSDPGLVLTGFYSSRRWFYSERPTAAKGYVSDLAFIRHVGSLNPVPVQRALTDKLEFARTLDAHGLGDRMPRMLGVSRNGRFEPTNDPTGEAVIIKPVDGAAGRGLALFDSVDDAVAACPTDRTYLIQERVRAHPYGAEIFPGSLNALRVQVVRSVPGGPATVAAVAQRIGTRASAPGHAFSSGGLIAGVQRDGTLTYAVGSLRGQRHQERHQRHPETGAQIAGRTLPQYDAALGLALEMMDLYPDATYVGWDIAIAESGPIVLEGNATWPNLSVLQAHGPLAVDPETRRYCVGRGLLPRG